MAHQRGHSLSDAKEPHSVSLKVLRLSRPSLSLQHPLPTPTVTSPASQAVGSSYAYPRKPGSTEKPDAFILAPLLTLPQTFGSAYVGETFSCTLCANNELPFGGLGVGGAGGAQKTISNVRIEAEMKVPSSTTPISLPLGPDAYSGATSGVDEDKKEGKGSSAGVALKEGESLQRIVSFELREEGSHVLAVTVTYSETTPTSGRIRTFRKLYQFVSKGCMVVRTKAGALPTKSKDGRKRWALEAQLENAGDEGITLDDVVINTREGFRGLGLNWSSDEGRPVLLPGDVQQVCFLIEDVDGKAETGAIDGRVIFGKLHIRWRGQMGNEGYLDTGNLGARVT